jgi:hypothetical protein
MPPSAAHAPAPGPAAGPAVFGASATAVETPAAQTTLFAAQVAAPPAAETTPFAKQVAAAAAAAAAKLAGAGPPATPSAIAVPRPQVAPPNTEPPRRP